MKYIKAKFICSVSMLFVATFFGPGPLFSQDTQTVQGTADSDYLTSRTGAGHVAVSPNAITESLLHIGPGDLVEMKVFNVPELGQDIRVSDQGDASINLIGSVHLAGLTSLQAQELIARKFQEGNFVLNPHVSVMTREYGTQGVSVLGEVKNPGVYQVLGSRSLLDVLSLAGGTTPYADSQATIKRHVDGSVLVIRLTRDASASLSTDVELQPGDKVIIPRAGIVYVLGDVEHAGGFQMRDDGRLTILQALTLAGGNTRTASLSGTRLIRKTVNGYTDTTIALNKILKGSMSDSQLQPDDILYVPNSATKSIIYRTVPSIVTSASTAAIYLGMM
jgi:polysaccharide export outer membrane protein